MPTTDIGPCECCGGVSCPCTTYAVCYWEWNGGEWIPFGTPNPCNGADEQNRPIAACCQCPGPPEDNGQFTGQVAGVPCTQLNPYTSMCDCFHCYATWNAFTEMWEAGECLGPDDQQDSSYTCACPTAQLSPGDTHGQMLYVICGCPS